ncbi:MAG: hypothetical protein QNJ40_13505 [Xanthomonadales bacterium]|nr:hypothetical protein [Xanthomonadales bacterium]
MNSTHGNLLERFERLEIPAPDFHHAEHVQVAYAMLEKYDFVEACSRYAATIRAMAEQVGVPEKFNTTITFAFMSLIAERRDHTEGAGLESFLRANPDLLDTDVLGAWYTRERLTSARARRQFLLPDKLLGASQ